MDEIELQKAQDEDKNYKLGQKIIDAIIGWKSPQPTKPLRPERFFCLGCHSQIAFEDIGLHAKQCFKI